MQNGSRITIFLLGSLFFGAGFGAETPEVKKVSRSPEETQRFRQSLALQTRCRRAYAQLLFPGATLAAAGIGVFYGVKDQHATESLRNLSSGSWPQAGLGLDNEGTGALEAEVFRGGILSAADIVPYLERYYREVLRPFPDQAPTPQDMIDLAAELNRVDVEEEDPDALDKAYDRLAMENTARRREKLRELHTTAPAH